MNGANILGDRHFFSAFWASHLDLDTIIFMLPPAIGAEGIVFELSIRPCVYVSRDLVNAL